VRCYDVFFYTLQFTPLIVAALQGQMSAADALLDEGDADVKARNSRGKQHL
jgi:ankyrin repeat protein